MCFDNEIIIADNVSSALKSLLISPSYTKKKREGKWQTSFWIIPVYKETWNVLCCWQSFDIGEEDTSRKIVEKICQKTELKIESNCRRLAREDLEGPEHARFEEH